MAIKVIITPAGEQSLKKVKRFILEKFTQREYDKLLKEVERITNQLRIGNVDYNYSKNKDIYKVVLHKRCTMYYKKVSKNQTNVVYFLDNRMMQGKNKLE